MKVAFLMKDRPDYEERIPAELDWFRIAADSDGVYTPEDLAKVESADGLILAHEPVHETLLEACPNLKIIQRTGVGFDTVDTEAAARRGIPVCNLGDVNKDALGEHGMALMLGLSRRLVDVHRTTQAGDWWAGRAILEETFELMGRTLGILGFGKSGYELARRARAFGMEILYHNRSQVDARLTEAVQAQPRGMEDLFRQSDFLSVHVSLNPSTVGLVDGRLLGLMKPTACLINLARGGIVEEAALAEALNTGRLGGAGIDVFSQEPIAGDNPLLGARNCLLTPHSAGTTKECTDREILWSVENLRRYLERGEKPRWIVNGVEV